MLNETFSVIFKHRAQFKWNKNGNFVHNMRRKMESRNGLEWLKAISWWLMDCWRSKWFDDGSDGSAENLFVLIISWQFWGGMPMTDWIFLAIWRFSFFKDHFLAAELGFKLIIQFSLSLFSKLSRLNWYIELLRGGLSALYKPIIC